MNYYVYEDSENLGDILREIHSRKECILFLKSGYIHKYKDYMQSMEQAYSARFLFGFFDNDEGETIGFYYADNGTLSREILNRLIFIMMPLLSTEQAFEAEKAVGRPIIQMERNS